MYVELKPLEALRAAELPQVAAPWYAISWLKSAQSGFCQVRGFHNIWEACIHELDPHRDHWNHRARGFDLLCERIRNGEMVVVLDPSWPPLGPAYAKVNGQWEPNTQHVFELSARQRYTTQTQTLEHRQRELEALQSQNRPPTPKEITPASGQGNKPVALRPHADGGTFHKQDEKTAGSGAGSAATKQATTESQKTVDSAINSIKESSFANTVEGKKVISKIDELNASGKIKFDPMSSSIRGKWSGSEVVVNANFSADADATASELVHEATHALHEDEYPASKKKITIDEEMRTNENQLALYEDQRKGGFRDPELEQRRNDQAGGKLRDNVRRRYSETPEHL